MKKEDRDQDQVKVQFPLSTVSYDHQGSIHIEQLSQQNHQSNERLSIGGSSSVQSLFFNSSEPAVDRAREEQTEAKWMSSKMRLMRKMMMGEDRIAIRKQGSSSSSNSNSNGIIRVCSNCSTTKTPLWRSGPQGPKSLCNACGIRQMKARRAMRAAAAAAAAASAGGGVLQVPATAPKKAAAAKEGRLEVVVDRTVPFKKRFKIATSSSSAQKKKKNITISSSRKLAFHQTSTFPQEEKDAAILLMALSCGLIHG